MIYTKEISSLPTCRSLVKYTYFNKGYKYFDLFYDLIRAVLESQCDNFDARLDVASEEDATLIILRKTDQIICCPERDVKTCDLDKGFR